VDQAGNKGSSEEEVVVVVAQYRKAGVEAEAGIDHNCSEEVAEEELRTKQASRASCLNQKGILTLVRSLLVQLNNSEVSKDVLQHYYSANNHILPSCRSEGTSEVAYDCLQCSMKVVESEKLVGYRLTNVRR